MDFAELKTKMNEGMVNIQWDMLRCHDVYRLNKLAERLHNLGQEILDLSAETIDYVENEV